MFRIEAFRGVERRIYWRVSDDFYDWKMNSMVSKARPFDVSARRYYQCTLYGGGRETVSKLRAGFDVLTKFAAGAGYDLIVYLTQKESQALGIREVSQVKISHDGEITIRRWRNRSV